MKRLLKPILPILFLLTASIGFSQKTETYTNNELNYREGLSLFEKEKYVMSQSYFRDFIESSKDENSEMHINAAYYSAICDLYLFHKNAEYLLEEFMTKYPDSHWNKTIYFELATYNYKRKKYKKSLEWFEDVDVRKLTPEQKTEFHFKRGHSAFMQEDYATARQDFFEVKDLNSMYQAPATYYYAHIAYADKEYQTALNGFSALQEGTEFSPIVPYYITQIYYFQERYDQLVEYATPMLDSGKVEVTERIPEIAQLLGDAYYRQEDYKRALPYLDIYNEKTKKQDRTREDNYQYGFCLYQTGEYAKALEAFNNAAGEDDELGQSAIYHMGDCYLHLDQKEYARTAFKEASGMNHNMKVKEDALFNYAKLAFELSYNPFHEAIKAFETYLNDYPNSPRSDEAYEFLLSVYMKTKNYEAALNSLNRIETKDALAKSAYQVLSFNQGVELFSAGEFEEAKKYFNQVDDYNIDQELTSEAVFWLGEIAYRQKKYTAATSLYNQFLKKPGAYNSKHFNDANYGAGYALFKRELFVDAATSFRKYIQESDDLTSRKYTDANLRIGDCYYVTKDYPKAISYYNAAIDAGQFKTDYALFQKGVCFGLDNQNDKEISILKSLLNEYPSSDYTADAKFELANTYKNMDDRGNATLYYTDLIENHSNSPYVKRSWLDMLLIDFKNQDNDQVIAVWNHMNETYPNDPILIDAYQIAEPVLIDQGLTTNLPDIIDVDATEIQFKTFQSARDYALSGECDVAITKLSAYLIKYEPATFAKDANYYLGRCYFDQGKNDEALNAFNYVISQPVSDYTEECLLIAATLNFNNEQFEQARNNYIELENVALLKQNKHEAQIGLMRCYYFLGEFDKAEDYADKVIDNPDTPGDIRNTAHLWRGIINYDSELWDEAYYDFAEVNKRGGAKGAEAKYYMARIAYNKAAYKPCEKEIFELIETYASYNEWKHKGFLLLADVYIATEDYFQAKATLNAILDNVDVQWVRDGANQRLMEIELLENPPEEDNEFENDIEEEVIDED